MDRRSGNRPKKKNNKFDVCKYSKMGLDVRYYQRENNKIVTLGPSKESVIVEVCFSHTSVIFAGDLAAAGCP